MGPTRRDDPPTYSVIVPFFNERETLGPALESVVAQTYDRWEIVAVDDGSSDGSADVADGFAATDPRITVIRRANGGLPAARNSGLAVARGSFCALLDADDLWLPEKLERQLPLLDDHTVVFSDTWVEEGTSRQRYGSRVGLSDGVYPRGDVLDELLRQNFVPSLTAVVPTGLLRSVGGFSTELPISLDWDLWLRLALAGVRFDYVPDPLAVYRLRRDSLSSDQETLRREAVAVLARFRARASEPMRAAATSRLRTARRELEVFLRKRAWVSAAAGDTGSARRDLAGSLRSNPRSLRAVAGAALALAPPALRWFARRRPPASFTDRFVRL